jgi:hypothetical protein
LISFDHLAVFLVNVFYSPFSAVTGILVASIAVLMLFIRIYTVFRSNPKERR